MRHPTNPYVAGAALRGGKGFFGRRDKLSRVERELRNPTTTGLVLFGQRRIGKTSLLMQLCCTLPGYLFAPVYFDLQDQASRPLAQVLADLADTAAERVGLDAPDPDAFDDAGRYFRRVFLSQLYERLGEGRRPVFLLDEFDVMGQRGESERDDTTAANMLFPFLRRVMSEDHRPAFVFVVGRHAGDLSLDFTATFKTALVQEIWVLDRESARKLVLQAESDGTLCFTDRAVQEILRLTCCHPYLTQLLCQRIWEQAYEGDPGEPPLVDCPAVEAAVPDALRSGDQALAWMWDGLGPAERIFASTLAEVGDGKDGIPEDLVVQTLTARAFRLRTREVERAPRDLVKRRVLEVAGGQGHRFTLEIFGRWVRQNRPLDSVKDEVDRVEPMAERLYGLGLEFFGRRQWENAARYFRDALDVYPNHFRARLYLGEALLEMGQIDNAVTELERAHELDQEEAKFALARAMALARTSSGAATLVVDESRGRVYVRDREIKLSLLEHQVLHRLAREAGQIVSKQALASDVQSHKGFERASIDAAIYRLRKKLGDNVHSSIYLETKRGQGYILHHAAYIPDDDAG
jgi:DNA-binding winged helix-turn-helix (wHTH) protein